MELKGKTIAVTGASGFFGGYIVEVLVASGALVRALVRDPNRRPALNRMPGVEVVRADLLDVASLVRGLSGVDAVVGNAAMATPSVKGWEENYLPNKVGTENLCDAMKEAGVRRCVHISTIGVYDMPPTQLFRRRPFREDHPLVTPRHVKLVGAYRVTKALAEEAARSRARLYGQDLTILRTSATYGYRDPSVIPALKRFMKWPLLPAPKLVFSLVYAVDAAHAVVESLAREVSIGKVYNVAGDPANSLHSLLEAWKRVTGEGPRLLSVPMPIRIAFDNHLAEEELGFVNRPMEDAIREILAREASETD